MVTIETGELGIAIIFEYPNPFQRSLVEEWAEGEDFEVVSGEQRLPGLPEGVDIEGTSTKIGERGRFRVIYNPEGNLPVYGECAFVTIGDTNGGDSDELEKLVKSFLDEFSDKGLLDQRDSFEVTLEGTVRVGNEYSISECFSNRTTNNLSEQFGASIGDGAVRITSEKVEDQSNYYKFLFDGEATNNPSRWGAKFIRRYNNLSDYEKGTLLDELRTSMSIFEISD